MKLFPMLAATLALAAPAFAQGADAMKPMKGMDQSSMTTLRAAGVVKAVDAAAGTITIQHGPIAALKWPAMTMTFKAAPPSLLRGIAVGQSVKFELIQMGGATQLTAIHAN